MGARDLFPTNHAPAEVLFQRAGALEPVGVHESDASGLKNVEPLAVSWLVTTPINPQAKRLNVNRFCSLFSQILKFIPRDRFERAVRGCNAERHARGVSCWQQLVSMLFCQLGRAHSLREIEQGLRSCEGKLTHLGITPLPRSSLDYANAHRPWQLFERVLQELMSHCLSQTHLRHKFRFRHKLLSLDATTIDLSVSIYDWAKFCRTKGAVKLHLLLDHEGYLPAFAVLSAGDVHDVRVAQRLRLQPGTIVVEDRGYTDYELYGRWSQQQVYFVTRMRSNALYEVLNSLPVPPTRTHILKDE